jgi:hypothetical protein
MLHAAQVDIHGMGYYDERRYLPVTHVVPQRKDTDSIRSVVKVETLADTESGGSEDSVQKFRD